MARTDGEETEYPRVKHELRSVLRVTRDCPPGETARLLLSYDTAGNRLTGLVDGGEAVVYYFEARNAPVKIRFDGTGLDENGGIEIASVNSPHEFQQWVWRLTPYYWEWLHPRYRSHSQ